MDICDLFRIVKQTSTCTWLCDEDYWYSDSLTKYTIRIHVIISNSFELFILKCLKNALLT